MSHVDYILVYIQLWKILTSMDEEVVNKITCIHYIHASTKEEEEPSLELALEAAMGIKC